MVSQSKWSRVKKSCEITNLLVLEPRRKPGNKLEAAGVSAKVRDACQVLLALIRTSLASFKMQELGFVKHSIF